MVFKILINTSEVLRLMKCLLEYIVLAGRKANLILKSIFLRDSIYIPLLILMTFFSAFLNFNAKSMSGLLPAYIDFSNLFETGFELDHKKFEHLYTFPMWGYGFLFLITKSKTIIVILQQLFTLFTIYFVDRCLKTLGWKNLSRIAFRAFSIILFSWYFFHTVLWPYSWGANLLIISLFLLLLHIETSKIKYAILSGLSYGLMLNFRSEYYFFGIALFFTLLIFGLLKLVNIKIIPLVVWLVLIFAMLIPWGWYSYQKTGEVLLKSSNAGHVLFISLGQLPNNKWGITPLDNDPKMREVVDQKVEKGAQTLGNEADKVLTDIWLEYIKNDKREFFKKVKHNFSEIFDYPFYNGEVLKQSNGYADYLLVNTIDKEIQKLANEISEEPYWRKELEELKLFLYGFSKDLIDWFLWGLVFILFVKKLKIFSDPFFVILFLLVGYQWSLMTLAYFMPGYHTNILVIYILLIVYCWLEVNPLGKFYYTIKYYVSKKRLRFKLN